MLRTEKYLLEKDKSSRRLAVCHRVLFLVVKVNRRDELEALLNESVAGLKIRA